MIDVERGRLIENATIVVQGGRIVAAGPAADVRASANACIQLPDTTLLPGLIDAHVHLTLAGAPAANGRRDVGSRIHDGTGSWRRRVRKHHAAR